MSPAEQVAEKKKKRKPKVAKSSTNRHLGVLKCNLRAIRDALGLTIRDVANGTSLSVGTLAYTEMGQDICLTNARKVSKFFGKPIEEIWPDD
jgi:hypothetical protein